MRVIYINCVCIAESTIQWMMSFECIDWIQSVHAHLIELVWYGLFNEEWIWKIISGTWLNVEVDSPLFEKMGIFGHGLSCFSCFFEAFLPGSLCFHRFYKMSRLFYISFAVIWSWDVSQVQFKVKAKPRVWTTVGLWRPCLFFTSHSTHNDSPFGCIQTTLKPVTPKLGPQTKVCRIHKNE
jgi:hypothetical protein